MGESFNTDTTMVGCVANFWEFVEETDTPLDIVVLLLRSFMQRVTSGKALQKLSDMPAFMGLLSKLRIQLTLTSSGYYSSEWRAEVVAKVFD